MNSIRLEVGASPIPGWKLVELRGRGGFADVWEAVDPNGKRMAIKFMASKNSTSSVNEMRIIQAIQKIEHPNILHMERILSVPGYIVIVMELADGSLFDLLEAYQSEYHQPMSADIVLHYLTPLADALDLLNSHDHQLDGRKVGFQHADIKPSNLLLVGDVPKLGDFGLCRPTTNLNLSSSRSGTLDFAAPESHRGLMTDRSDQYSLAVTYFHLRTGKFPFPEIKTGFKREHSYLRPSPNLTGVGREEARVLERALTIEPLHRWPTCTAMMTAMREAIDQSSQASLSNSKFGTIMV